MNLFRQLWHRFIALFRRRNLEAEMAEEMRQHLEHRIQEKIADGTAPDEARYAAQREFGGLEQHKEHCRDERRFVWLEQFFQDLRQVVRTWRKSPGFTATAMLTLALGIGANTALFSVINSVLLRPLPFPNADRLTVVWETNAQQGVKREGPAGPNFYDWREQTRLFQDLAAVELGSGTLTGLGNPQQVPAMRVTTNLFSVLNVGPSFGRLFVPEDGRDGRQARVIVSHDFWRRALGSDETIIGKTITVDLIAYQVIGVLQPDFWLPIQADLFAPWPDDELRTQHGRLAHDLGVFGRLKPGVTAEEAEAELNAIHARLRVAHPELEAWGVTVVPLQTVTTEYIRPALIALFCAVTFVLLIACANVANLLLARALVRGREVAVRAALGATRGRLLRQFLTESLGLSLAAGALGTLLAFWGVTVLSAIVPATIPIPDAAADVTLRPFVIDGRVLAFSVVVSLITSLLFGLAPALHAMKVDVIESLKNGSRATGGGGRRLREVLLITEVALALVLLAGAGLMLRSFSRLQNADLGFRASQLLTLEMELPTDSRYRTGPEQSAFFAQVLERVGALPNVTSTAVTSVLPLHSQEQRTRFLIENGSVLPPNEQFQSDLRRVSPDYFRTMGIAFKRGRLLDGHDSAATAAPLVGLIDETFARRFFGDNDPVGRRLVLGKKHLEIVGVVGDVIHAGADREARPTLYVSFLQSPAVRMNLVLRTTTAPGDLVESVKRAVWSIDPDLPLYRIESMEEVVAGATSAPRLTLSLLGVFALVALVLATTGIYGVMAYTVSQRTNELGIRLALGATPADVLRNVLQHGLRVIAIGVALGLGAMFGLGQLVQSLLYHTSPRDPLVLGGVAVVLAITAFIACLVPARRATKIDPMVALRCE
jgi:putative ABC transport system permease protein